MSGDPCLVVYGPATRLQSPSESVDVSMRFCATLVVSTILGPSEFLSLSSGVTDKVLFVNLGSRGDILRGSSRGRPFLVGCATRVV